MKKFLFALLFVGFAALAQAQVVNPNAVQFTASPDHNATIVVGTTTVFIVDHYELNVIAGSPTGALSFTKVLGRPTPDAANNIFVTVSEFLNLSRGSYVATVAAVASGGASAVSAPTDPFVSTGVPAAPTTKPIVVRK